MSSSHNEKAVFDLQEFLFSLAVELCSHKTVKEKLETAKLQQQQEHPSSFRLYWRSPLLCSTNLLESIFVCSPPNENSTTTKKDEAKHSSSSSSSSSSIQVVFVDATWEFTRTSSISLYWGVLFFQTTKKNSFSYGKGSKMDYSTLQECMNQISIDLQTSQSHSIAKIISKALCNNHLPTTTVSPLLATTNNTNDDSTNNIKTIAIPLFYADVQDTGNLLLTTPIQVSHLDTLVMDLLLNNNIITSLQSNEIKSNDHSSSPHSSTTESQHLWKLFQDWKQQQNHLSLLSTRKNDKNQTHPDLRVGATKDDQEENPTRGDGDADDSSTVHPTATTTASSSTSQTTVDVQSQSSMLTASSSSQKSSKLARPRVIAPMMQRTGSNKKRKTRITYAGKPSQS